MILSYSLLINFAALQSSLSVAPGRFCGSPGHPRRGRTYARRWRFCRTEVSMHRALQFLEGGYRPYHCTAGDTLVTVEPNGDLYPCRRMPIQVGNMMETPLLKLYYGSDLFRSLRDRNRISDNCQSCFYSKLCRGGLKCLSYAVTGDPFRSDPGCWCALA